MTLATERIGYNIWKVFHQAFQRYLSLSLVCFDSSSVDTQCPFVMVFTINLYKQAICCILTFMQWRHSGWSNHGLFRGMVKSYIWTDWGKPWKSFGITLYPG